MKNLIIRSITGVIFVAAIVTCFLRPIAMVFLFAVVTGMTVWEFTGLVNRRENVSVNRFITTVAAVYLFLAMMGYNSGLTPDHVFVPYLVTLIYLLVAELYMKAEDPIHNWAYTMFSQLYIALPFSLLNVLAFPAPSNAYTMVLPLSVFIFLWVNDSGAYLAGSLLGRHKLFPRVSPGKSWEGSVGGALLVVAAAVAIWHLTINYAPQYSPSTVGMNMIEFAGMGVVVTVFGTWGDLVESLFKRTLHIKDSGNILPGHGGMLDRFDSSLLAIPAVVVYLYTISLF